MAGLETIIQKIQTDSDAHCASIHARACQEADAIREQARASADSEAADILSKAEKQAETIVQKAGSAAQTTINRAVLAEKVKMIHEVITQAAAKIKALPDAEYSEAIKKLVVRYARSGSGILRMSAQDAARLPSGFEDSLNTLLAEKGASLKTETSPMESGGFILIYGDVEQNCMIDALMDAMSEELKDQINHNLFS